MIEGVLAPQSYRYCGPRLFFFRVFNLSALGYSAFCKNIAGSVRSTILNSKIKANTYLSTQVYKTAKNRQKGLGTMPKHDI